MNLNLFCPDMENEKFKNTVAVSDEEENILTNSVYWLILKSWKE